ncbi:MAG: cyanophycin synthetase [Sphingobacteriales bacterium]|nr:MAG: cyanophycin synthetase [Sphingobacteriales bacterium]
METKEIKIMRGPNYWSTAHHNIIVLKTTETDSFAGKEAIYGMSQKYLGLLKSFPEKQFADAASRKYEAMQDSEQSPAHFIKNIAISLQELSHLHVEFGEVILEPGKDFTTILVEYVTERAGKFAVESALQIAEALKNDLKINLETYTEKIHNLHHKEYLGPSTMSIVNEVVQKGVPYIGNRRSSYIQFGYGSKQKRINASITSLTPSIAVDIAGDKMETKELLHSFNIPVPIGVTVYDRHDLNAAIEEVGYPIVVKPLDGNQGKGATINATDWTCALKGFLGARKYSKGIIIETFVTGFDYRLLVINKKFVAASLRTPAMVTGDGKSTIQQLINLVNKDPRRGSGHEKVLTKIKVDDMTKRILSDLGLTLSSVLPNEKILYLKDTANLSTGGTATDVTDEIHPDNIFMAEQIAQIVGLDICGIDVMTTDISKPLKETKGAIIEVNAAPGLRMHTNPTYGKARNVGKAIADMLFPEGEEYNIPIVAVTGTNGKTTTSRLIAHIAKTAEHRVGFTNTDGIYIQGHQMESGDCSGPASAQFVLRNPSVDFAVLECARGGILRSGLGFAECNIGVVTNVASDHLGIGGIDTLDDLANVKSVVPRSVREDGYAVLNANDDLVYDMHKKVKSKVALFSLDDEKGRIGKHIANGGLAATVQGENIVILEGEKVTVVDKVKNIPLTLGGRATFNIENVMAALLASYKSNIPLETIKKGLYTFIPSPEQTPGRLNIFNFDGFEVMVDYAHNPAGMKALAEFLKRVDNKPKVGVIAAVGDRRDEDIMEMGKQAACMFDEIIIRLDDDLRGRTAEEIYGLVKKGIETETKNKPVITIENEVEACNYALKNAKQGSFITMCTDKVQRAIDTVKQFKESGMMADGVSQNIAEKISV